MDLKYMYELFSDMPRQGPGSKECTRRAFNMLSDLSKQPFILDIGCGSGMQTLELARISDARITAVDNYQPFLDDLYGRVALQGLSGRIETVNASMFDLPFESGSFDVIWSEGTIYIIGFENGLCDWKPLLKPGGYMVASEITWLQPDPPVELDSYWKSEYAGIRNKAENIDIIRRVGYKEAGHFVLPESGWWDNFYIPLQKRIDLLKRKYAGNRAAAEVLDASQAEIDMYQKYSPYYGYVFYLMHS